MRLSLLFNFSSVFSFGPDVWISIIIGAIVTFAIGFLIYIIQKREARLHKKEHDSKLAELKEMHLQDSEKIQVLYELIIQSQKGNLDEIESSVLEQKIEAAADLITEQDSDKAQALKAIAEKDKDKADDLLDQIAQKEHELVEVYRLRALNEHRNGYCNEAVRWYRKITELVPADLSARLNLLSSLISADQTTEARGLGETMLSELTKQTNPDPKHLIDLYACLIQSYPQEVFTPDCEEYINRMIGLAGQNFGENSSEMLTSLMFQASYYNPSRSEKDNEEIYLKCLSIIESGSVPDDYDVFSVYLETAWLYFTQQRFDEALTLLEKASSEIDRLLGAEHPAHADPLTYKAYIHTSKGELMEAEKTLLKALELVEGKLGAEHQRCMIIKSALADVYGGLQRFAEAETILRELIGALTRKEGEDSYQLGAYYHRLAIQLANQQKLDEAEQCFAKALSIWSPMLDDKQPAMLYLQADMYSLYSDKGELAKAEEGFLKLIGLLAESGSDPEQRLPFIKYQLAHTYAKQKRFSEAEPYARQALEYMQEQMPGSQHCANCLENYADILKELGRLEEAEVYKQQAEEQKARFSG
jgi:tetratricopeptide (TPR) repeat protein